METIKYRNSAGRSIMYMVLGIFVALIGRFIPLLGILAMILGIGAFAMGLVSLLKRRPQLILDDEGFYIGFKEKVKLPWSKIQAVSVKKTKIDGVREVWMLKVKAKFHRHGKDFYKVVEANIEMLGIDGRELQAQIDEYRGVQSDLV